MKTNMKRILMPAIAAAALTAGAAHGKECKGVTFPDQAQVEGSSLTLNGLGLRQATFLKVNVYVAALYVAKTSSDPAAKQFVQPLADRGITIVEAIGAALEGWKKLSRKQQDQVIQERVRRQHSTAAA